MIKLRTLPCAYCRTPKAPAQLYTLKDVATNRVVTVCSTCGNKLILAANKLMKGA